MKGDRLFMWFVIILTLSCAASVVAFVLWCVSKGVAG